MKRKQAVHIRKRHNKLDISQRQSKYVQIAQIWMNEWMNWFYWQVKRILVWQIEQL